MSAEPGNLDFLSSHVVSSGLIYDPRLVEPEPDRASSGLSLFTDDKYELRFSSFEHRWWCNTFNVCHSVYNVNAFIINKATGQKVNLRAVETAVGIQDANTPIDYDPSKGGYYRHYDNVTDFYIGCGQKEGHDPDYWGVAKCYFPSGEIVSWRWTSHA